MCGHNDGNEDIHTLNKKILLIIGFRKITLLEVSLSEINLDREILWNMSDRLSGNCRFIKRQFGM